MKANNEDGHFTFSTDVKSEKKSAKVTDRPLIGKIGTQIGTGANAKDSFIWMTVTWSFYISTGLSILIYVQSFYLIESSPIDVMTQIKDIWSIFTPIITLALGYAFGKGQ